jgi:hypothetical protein
MARKSDFLSSSEKKRKGQYFTGIRLARVLASLVSDRTKALTVIDPMAGTGDMLAAVASQQSRSELLGAIEIDPVAFNVCEENIRSLESPSFVVNGNAFQSGIWKKIGTDWDLVITNPPYVRYQSLSSSADLNPSGDEVRKDLVETLEQVSFENEAVREDFLQTARRYSGLSDLAVPCWILCMAICKVGGDIALILPSTWLSREYSSPVLYLLRRYFLISVVVEDPDVCWFPGTQVRTTALVATRVPDRGSALLPNTHKVISIPRASGHADSLVGMAFQESKTPESDFARWVKECEADTSKSGIIITLSNESELVQKINVALGGNVKAVEVAAPQKMQKILGSHEVPLISLAHLGWNVGQGMRTGANNFFYLSRSGSPGRYRSRLVPGEDFEVPQRALMPAMTRQHELPSGYLVEAESVETYLMYLRGWDFAKNSQAFRTEDLIEGDLRRLIERAEGFVYTKFGKEVKIPDLTAVKTNVRSSRSGEITGRWFQLPALAKRHLPELFIPRIIGGEIKTYLNSEPKLVIDANFNTLWSTDNQSISKYALLALMNSDWSRSWLESSCTTMGGGALKIEAVNLKSMYFPEFLLNNVNTLGSLGHLLINQEISEETFQSKTAAAMNLNLESGDLNRFCKKMSSDRNSR